jgi:hypothetical protein
MAVTFRPSVWLFFFTTDMIEFQYRESILQGILCDFDFGLYLTNVKYHFTWSSFGTFTGRDSVDFTATGCWLDRPGIEFRWERDFSNPSPEHLWAHRTSYTMGTESLSRG